MLWSSIKFAVVQFQPHGPMDIAVDKRALGGLYIKIFRLIVLMQITATSNSMSWCCPRERVPLQSL
jgi:hypothetical protein